MFTLPISLYSTNPIPPTYAFGYATFTGSNALQMSTAGPALTFTGDFTTESYVYLSQFPSANAVTFVNNYASATGFSMQYRNDGTSRWTCGNGDTPLATYNATPTLNTWYHFAVSRAGSTLRMFINGAVVATTTSTGTIGVSSNPVYIAQLAGVQRVVGRMSNVRTSNVALYTSAFTPTFLELDVLPSTMMLALRDGISDSGPSAYPVTQIGSVPWVFGT